MKTLLICGGVGGAKLAKGFYQSKQDFDVLVNIGDDFNHFGLHISPDLDTVMYTLSDRVNTSQGWGLEDDTWKTLKNIELIGGDTWFQLGDKDLATHMVRTQLLKTQNLTQTTQKICQAFNLSINLFPASEDLIQTTIYEGNNSYSFQEYFVKHKTNVVVSSIAYLGLEQASLNPNIDLETYNKIIICPSNPYLSIDPIVKINELWNFLNKNKERVFVISPIVADASLKGPTAKIMHSLGIDVNVISIAKHYRAIADNIFIDERDKHYAQEISSLGMNPYLSKHLVMTSDQDKISLAVEIVKVLNA